MCPRWGQNCYLRRFLPQVVYLPTKIVDRLLGAKFTLSCLGCEFNMSSIDLPLIDLYEDHYTFLRVQLRVDQPSKIVRGAVEHFLAHVLKTELSRLRAW